MLQDLDAQRLLVVLVTTGFISHGSGLLLKELVEDLVAAILLVIESGADTAVERAVEVRPRHHVVLLGAPEQAPREGLVREVRLHE